MKSKMNDEQRLTAKDRSNLNTATKQTTKLSEFSLRKRITVLKNEWWYWDDDDVIPLEPSEEIVSEESQLTTLKEQEIDTEAILRLLNDNANELVDVHPRDKRIDCYLSGWNRLSVRFIRRESSDSIDRKAKLVGLLSSIDIRWRRTARPSNDQIDWFLVHRLPSCGGERISALYTKESAVDIVHLWTLVLSVCLSTWRPLSSSLSSMDRRNESFTRQLAIPHSHAYISNSIVNCFISTSSKQKPRAVNDLTFTEQSTVARPSSSVQQLSCHFLRRNDTYTYEINMTKTDVLSPWTRTEPLYWRSTFR